jgi:hypothetical protein
MDLILDEHPQSEEEVQLKRVHPTVSLRRRHV